MQSIKYRQKLRPYSTPMLEVLSIIIGLLLLCWGKSAFAQTNDPKLSQQYYIFDHNIDQAWNFSTGSANTHIAIHSMAGFTSSHEDLEGARYLNPWTQWFGPQYDYASEIAGIVGAQTNNGIGMAGIDWNAAMKSYNILRLKQSGDDNPDATFTYGGQDYYLDTGKLSTMVDQAIQDGMDIQVFTFGVPSAKLNDLKKFEGINTDQLLKTTVVPTFSDPNQSNDFWKNMKDMILRIGGSIWNSIEGNNYTPPSNLEQFRQKLWEATQPANNDVILAPVGDVQSQEQLKILMPASMDDYVVTVAGAAKDANNQYFQWSNSQAAPYVDVSAAANNIVSISGTGYSDYDNNFNSTAAATGIVAGVSSLLKAENSSLTHEDIEQILERTATDLETTGKDDKTGYGFVNAQAALDYVQSNDFHHDQATNATITINSDVQANPNQITLDSQYLTFSHYNVVTAYGKLRKITGTVTFDLPYVSTPEAWLRMTSTGIDSTIIPVNRNYYDRYDKAFKITSVNTSGFDFELYYWKVDYYTESGQKAETVNVPDVYNNLTLDYTAVGTESTPPPPPLTVSISGPQTLSQQDGIGYWSADVTGGVSPYSYQWQARNTCRTGYNCGSETWQPAGTQQTISYTYSSSVYSLELKVTVTDDQSTSKTSGIYTVYYDPPSYSLTATGPNPFNPTTNLSYALPEQADVTMEVYNIMGRKVATLADGSKQPGRYTVRFDASHLASGMYLVNFTAVTATGQITRKTMKLQLLK